MTTDMTPNPNQKLTLTQQVRMKDLEYKVEQMSREQLEQYCLEIALNYLLYQNTVQEMAKDGWFGQLGGV